MKKIVTHLLIISLLSFVSRAPVEAAGAQTLKMPSIPAGEPVQSVQDIENQWKGYEQEYADDVIRLRKSLGKKPAWLDPKVDHPLPTENTKGTLRENLTAMRPGMESFVIGNAGFMIGAAMQMWVMALIQKDKAGAAAAIDSINIFSKDFDSAGALNLAIFSLTSSAFTSLLTPRAEASRIKMIGDNSITNWSMVAGSVVSSLFSQVWNSPARGLAWENFREWTRTSWGLGEKEYWQWGQGALKLQELNREISGLNTELNLIYNAPRAKDEEKQKKEQAERQEELKNKLIAAQQELSHIEPNVIRLRRQAWENFKATFKPSSTPSKLIEDMVLSSLRLVIVVQTLHLVTKAGGNIDRPLVWLLQKYAEKVPLRFIPVRFQPDNVARAIVNGHEVLGRYFNIFGEVISASKTRYMVFQTAMSAMNAVVFLTMDLLIRKPFNDITATVKLNWNMTEEGFTRSSFELMNAKTVSEQETKYNELVTNLDEYFQNFGEFEQKVILGEFNQRRGNWTKIIEKLDTDWSQTQFYFEWLARSYLKNPRKGTDYLDYQDSTFLSNGGDHPWHKDPILKTNFAKELDHFVLGDEDFNGFNKVIDAYQMQKMAADGARQRGQEVTDISIVEFTKSWLLQQQGVYRMNLRRETDGMISALKDIAYSSFFTAQAPFYKIEIPKDLKFAKLIGQNARYNMRDSLVRQYELLREKYLALNLPPSIISTHLEEGLLHNSSASAPLSISAPGTPLPEGIMATLKEIGSLQPRTSFDEKARPYSVKERSDLVALEFAKRFAQITVSYRLLPLQYQRLIEPTETVKTNNKIFNPFPTEQEQSGLQKALASEGSNYEEAHDIRNLTDLIKKRQELQSKDINEIMPDSDLEESPKKSAVEVKKSKKPKS